MSDQGIPQAAVEAAAREWWKGFDDAKPDMQRAMLADHALCLAAALPALTDSIRGPVEAELAEERRVREAAQVEVHKLNDKAENAHDILRESRQELAEIRKEVLREVREALIARMKVFQTLGDSHGAGVLLEASDHLEAEVASLSEDGDACERCGGSREIVVASVDGFAEGVNENAPCPDCTQPVAEEEQLGDLSAWLTRQVESTRRQRGQGGDHAQLRYLSGIECAYEYVLKRLDHLAAQPSPDSGEGSR